MNKCSKCGQDYQLSKKDKVEKGATAKLLKMISAADPMIAVALQEAQDYCYPCWKHRLMEVVGPLTLALTGQAMKENSEETK